MLDDDPFKKMRKEMKAVGVVPWQVAAVLAGLALGVPCAGFGTWGFLSAKGMGSAELALIFAVPGYVLIIWAGFGIWSRVSRAKREGEPISPMAKKLVGGAALIAGTVAVGTTLSMLTEMPRAILVPLGMLPMGFGALLMTWAMLPPKKKPEYPSLGITPGVTAAANSPPLAPTKLPPRPRRTTT